MFVCACMLCVLVCLSAHKLGVLVYFLACLLAFLRARRPHVFTWLVCLRGYALGLLVYFCALSVYVFFLDISMYFTTAKIMVLQLKNSMCVN